VLSLGAVYLFSMAFGRFGLWRQRVISPVHLKG